VCNCFARISVAAEILSAVIMKIIFEFETEAAQRYAAQVL
jgi:hypothetical protein